MLPVAIGVGEGGEFYRPMAVAIIGGTITSTFLTLLMVPSFYDSIEIKRDSFLAKFHAREARWTTAGAVLMGLVEIVLFLTLVRFVYRSLVSGWRLITGKGRRGAGQAQPHGAD